MQSSGSSTLGFLTSLAPVEQLWRAGRQQGNPKESISVNAHIHLPPNFSAFHTVRQAVDMAAGQKLNVLGAGNYYDFQVYREFSQYARKAGIFPLFGTEIIALEAEWQRQKIRVNDPGNPGKYYICGKGITRFEAPTARASKLIETIRQNDAQRMSLMTEKLSRYMQDRGLDLSLNDRAVIGRLAEDLGCRPETITLQERHIAQAFQMAIFEKYPPVQRPETLRQLFGGQPKSKAEDAVGVQNEIRSRLMKSGKPAFVPETFISPGQAKELILELGGIPCYPVLADGASPACEFEADAEKLADNLRAGGYQMAEFIPVRNQPGAMEKYAVAIRRAGIAVCSGTEHNTQDLIPLKPACAGAKVIPGRIEEMFHEGACVIVAHQFLCANGQMGFVETDGGGNRRYTDSGQRIRDFARLGEAVLETFFDNGKK